MAVKVPGEDNRLDVNQPVTSTLRKGAPPIPSWSASPSPSPPVFSQPVNGSSQYRDWAAEKASAAPSAGFPNPDVKPQATQQPAPQNAAPGSQMGATAQGAGTAPLLGGVAPAQPAQQRGTNVTTNPATQQFTTSIAGGPEMVNRVPFAHDPYMSKVEAMQKYNNPVGLTPTQGTYGTTPVNPAALSSKDGDAATYRDPSGQDKSWAEDRLYPNLLTGQYGMDPAALKAKQQAVDLQLEQQASADKERLQSSMGARGMAMSGAAAFGGSAIDQAKEAASAQNNAQMTMDNQKQAIAQKEQELQTAAQLAEKQGDWRTQQQIAKQLLDFQKQSQALEFAMQAPDKILSWVKDSGMSTADVSAMWKDISSAATSGDYQGMSRALGGIYKGLDGGTHYKQSTSQYADKTDAEKQSLFADWNSKTQGGKFQSFKDWLLEQGIAPDMSDNTGSVEAKHESP